MPSFPKLGTGRLSLPFVKRLDRYVKSLPAGDRFIAYALGWIVIATSVVGIYALERSFLVAVPAHGGSLTEGVVGTPRFVNPLLASTDADRDLVSLTYAGLMGHGENGLVPVLAESYEVSPSGTVYTFTLREDAQFSDGTPVTADDVVYTVQKAQDPGLKSPVLSNWANIRAEAVDARTVRFTLPRPYAPFLEDTTLGILPSLHWRKVTNAEFAFSPLNTVPVGAGPFEVSGISRGKNGAITAYHLKSVKTYAPGRAYLDQIHLVFYADIAALQAAVKKGAVDSAYGIATEGALRAPYARIFAVFFNPTNTPLFQKAEVRKALSLAVDREGLVEDVLGGYATASMGPVPGSSLPLPNEETRLAEARDALTAAKWTYDEEAGAWKNGAQTLSVTLKTSNVPELKAIATKVKADWEAFGVPTTVEFHDPSELTQTVIRPRTYGALLFGEVVGRTPDLYAFWSSKERTDPGLNIANYANTRVDLILERMRSERDPAKLAADLEETNRLIAADYPAVFLYTPDFVYTVPGDLEGVSLAGIAAPSDRFSNVARWYRHTELVWPYFARSSR